MLSFITVHLTKLSLALPSLATGNPVSKLVNVDEMLIDELRRRMMKVVDLML